MDALVRRLRHSDHEAYECIFQQMHEPLLKYVFRIMRDESLALDVLQDVFMKLWEKRGQLEIQVSLKALLYTMARNRALNIKRDRSKRSCDVEFLEEGAWEDHSSSAEQLVQAGQLDAYFRRWIDELPPRRAEAFALSRYHALSHKEIGAVMGLSKRTVDTHIVHALRFLRERYEKLQQQGVNR